MEKIGKYKGNSNTKIKKALYFYLQKWYDYDVLENIVWIRNDYIIGKMVNDKTIGIYSAVTL